MWTRVNILAASLTLAAAALASQAQAQTFYIGGEGGWSSLDSQRDRPNVGAPAITSRFDDGFAAGARAGYEMGPWRFEGEYVYREQNLNSIRVNGIGTFGAGGDRHAHAVMANVLYDVPLGNWMPMTFPVTPHIGVGVGAVNLTDTVRIAGRQNTDDDWVLGYQAIGGVRYNLSPALALDLDYKYFATEDARFRVKGTGINYRSGYESHNLMASLIYRFGAPAVAPPPPVAAPLPPAPMVASRKVFLVFFDWDRDTITRDGMQIIQQAAAAYKAGGSVRLQVTGYTDRSGSPGYNQRLSERRANNVAGALARLGVSRGDMAVSGRGENDNRVPTADGVREPQNRRVEIVFP